MDNYPETYSYSWPLAILWFFLVLWVSGLGRSLWWWLVATIVPKRVLLWRAGVLHRRLCIALSELKKERQNALEWKSAALYRGQDFEDVEYEDVKKQRSNSPLDDWRARTGEQGHKWQEKKKQSNEYGFEFDVTN